MVAIHLQVGPFGLMDHAIRMTGCQLGNHLIERFRDIFSRPRQRQAATQSAAREIHDIIDQPRHARHASLDQAGNRFPVLAQWLLANQPHPAGDAGQWIAQIVTENRDELFTQCRRFLFVQQRLVGLLYGVTGLDMIGDHLGKQVEHAQRFGFVDLRRLWRNCAERAEEAAVRK